MTIFITIVYWILLIFAVFSIVFSLPGTFLIVIFNIIYQLVDDIAGINWRLIAILLGISIFLELAEYGITAWSSKKYGASKAGIAGAIIGSIGGAVVGTGLFPLIGSLIGAFIGAFLGAYFVELLRTGNNHLAFQAGYGAFTGSVGAKLIKLVGAVTMLVMIAW